MCASTLRERYVNFYTDPTPDGIPSIDNGQLIIDNEAAAIYDLSGRKIVNSKLSNCKLNRLYIIGSKKFLAR